jgi:alanyl aminopeptidase
MNQPYLYGLTPRFLGRILILPGLLLMVGCAMLPDWFVKLRPRPAPDGSKPLSKSIKPTHYSLELSVDPEHERFGGQVAITLELTANSKTLQLHGGDLQILDVEVEDPGGIQKAQVATGPQGGLTLQVKRSLKPGGAVLRIRYTGRIHDTPRGLYKLRDQGRWYVYSRLGRTDARLLFPCFDEPRFKTPIKLALTLPKGLMGLANSKVINQSVQGPWKVQVYSVFVRP